MKKIILFFLISIIPSLIFAQGCPWPSHGGDNGPNLPCPKPFPWGGYDPEGKLSYDPNEIIGPTGVDSVRWVSVNDILKYTIMFENDPEFATAAAQRVDVRFDFQNKALQKGFGIGTYSFSNMSYLVDNAPNVYQNRINLADSLGIFVDVIGGLDVVKNQAFWTFSTIDPETGYAPWEHDKGVLQVNDSTHVGEGFVTFQLHPLATMQTGDTISIQANIVFDENDTIPTNRWRNKIDAGAPISKVMATANPSEANLYNISFESSDDKGGSGVKHVALYLANNSGLYEEYGVFAPDSIVPFPIEQGKQYKLFSIATDRTGNMESLKEQPDVVVNFNLPPTDITLSNDTFNDDLEIGGFIGELSTVDSDGDDTSFAYSLAEGEGSIHNDMFVVEGSQLKVNDCLKCAEDSTFNVRISTTDAGGLTFSKAFTLHLNHVLDKPETTYLEKEICDGDIYDFFGQELTEAGEYRYSKANEFMCDSLYVLNLQVKPVPEPPSVTIENGKTLVSSIEKGNIWFKNDKIIEDAEGCSYTPTESGVYWVAQSNGSCYSQPSDKFNVNIDNVSELSLSMPKGWSWISSNLADAEKLNPQNFLSSVIGNVNSFVGGAGSLISDSNGNLTGDLSEISPTTLYKIDLQNSDELDMTGNILLPDEVTQPLSTGWNWIGYIPSTELTVEEALANLTPAENDIIKGFSSFAVYSGGKWIGALKTMLPGNGYMYRSSVNTKFNYPYSRITRMSGTNEAHYLVTKGDSTPWSCDEHDYPDNMTLISEVHTEEGLAMEGAYLVAAFSGDVCRGIGEYIDNRLFMTIHGNQFDQNISFKAIENATGLECEIPEIVRFGEDGYGTMQNPFILTVGKSTRIADAFVAGSYNVYPNPVRETLFINGDVESIGSVKIIAISGVVVASQDYYDDESGMDVSTLIPGNYICGIVTKQGIIYKRFIKV